MAFGFGLHLFGDFSTKRQGPFPILLNAAFLEICIWNIFYIAKISQYITTSPSSCFIYIHVIFYHVVSSSVIIHIWVVVSKHNVLSICNSSVNSSVPSLEKPCFTHVEFRGQSGMGLFFTGVGTLCPISLRHISGGGRAVIKKNICLPIFLPPPPKICVSRSEK